MTTKTFHIGDIITITTGRLLSLEGIGGVHNILNWMTDDDLFTHQLGRAADEVKPLLCELFPDLVNLDIPEQEWTHESLTEWLATLGEQYREVPRLNEKDHARINPVLELQHMIGADRVLVVGHDDE